MQNSKRKYSGSGFVETLIAMAITGIAGVLLITVAIKTLNESVKTEISDEITVLDGNIEVDLQYLVESYNSGKFAGDSPIDQMLDNRGCFNLDVNYETVNSSTATQACPYTFNTKTGILDRSSCNINGNTGVFGLVCVADGSDNQLLKVDIVTGFGGCDGEGCDDFVNKELYILE